MVHIFTKVKMVSKRKGSVEREKAIERKKKSRANLGNRDFERQDDKQGHQKLRADPQNRDAEGQRNAEDHRKLRSDPQYRELERSRDAVVHQALRQDPGFRRQEQERDCEHHQVLRQDPGSRQQEQERDCEHHQVLRQDPGFRQQELERDCEHHQVLRQDPGFRQQEQVRDSVARSAFRNFRSESWDRLEAQYENEITQRPDNICCSCGGLFYVKSIKVFDINNIRHNTSINTALTSQQRTASTPVLCRTCHTAISKNKTKLSLSNGFEFPVIPEALCGLSQLEERLVAARLPFMQLKCLGSGRQHGLQGNIINVPNDLDTCLAAIPRTFGNTKTVKVMLMRQMKGKSPVWQEVVRPAKVIEAAKYLTNTDLYKEEGITFSINWKCDSSEVQHTQVETSNIDPAPNSCSSSSSSSEEEDEAPVNPGDEESMLLPENDLTDTVIKLAPGEGSHPMSILTDINAEV
jgi:hypothetical protein